MPTKQHAATVLAVEFTADAARRLFMNTTFRHVLHLSVLALASLLAACANRPVSLSYTPPDQPEGSSGYTEKPGWTTQHYAVAAANPLATDAGAQVLKAGGSAVDAAIAVQMVLTLVEPQSSGIGGGAFLLHYDGKVVDTFDGRETAPATADEKLFLKADGKPMAFHDGVVGGRSVGTPGTVQMLAQAHQQHGKLPWASLFEPAIQLATQGFKVSRRLNTLLMGEKYLKNDPVAAQYFYDAAGQPWPVGHVLKNPELADVLKRIAAQGARGLMEGEVAQAIVAKVQGHANNPGKLSLSDLAQYRARKREALCFDYAAAGKDYRVCGMPPPSSGAIAIGQILGMLNQTQAATLPLASGVAEFSGLTPSADWLHLYTEASRLAFADRAQYVGDPDFVQAPGGSWSTLLAPAYLKARASLIAQGPQGPSMRTARPGNPANAQSAYAPMPEQPEYGTSHISIVDANGHAVAMTTTIEDVFGSRQMVKGFLLNNELTDFSFAPADAAGQPIANRVQPGKRPRSSMSPTLVFDKATGKLVMSGGSPGGAVIIHYTAKTLYGVLNWGLTPQQAISLPNFASMNGPTLLEEKRFPSATVEALRSRGHEVREQNLTSGLQAIQTTAQGLRGGADPRREGVVMGQ
jgi:gamma-glutamyltranspeptidase/glutathione hydrolase